MSLAEDSGPSVLCRCGTGVRVVRFQPTRRAPVAPRRADVDTGTPCAYHVGNLATATCGRCGSFLCDLCATPIEGKTYCTACFERLNAEGRLASLGNHVSRPHAVAFAIALISVFPVMGLLFVPVAIWQGIKAIRQYRALSERERAVGVYLAFTVLLLLCSVAMTMLVFRESFR